MRLPPGLSMWREPVEGTYIHKLQWFRLRPLDRHEPLKLFSGHPLGVLHHIDY
jgi:hypothetical protein